MIYVAGTIGVDVSTGEPAGPTIKDQARQSLLNCQAILRAGGAELSDAVMVHTLLLRSEDADSVVEVIGVALGITPGSGSARQVAASETITTTGATRRWSAGTAGRPPRCGTPR
jgi:enamine deaminase RidA (YjgF/YER057c/UK114 family)